MAGRTEGRSYFFESRFDCISVGGDLFQVAVARIARFQELRGVTEGLVGAFELAMHGMAG